MNTERTVEHEKSLVEYKTVQFPVRVGSADALVHDVDENASVSGAIASRRRTQRRRHLPTLLPCATSAAAIVVAGVALAVAFAARAEIAELRALAANGARQTQASWWQDQLESFDFKDESEDSEEQQEKDKRTRVIRSEHEKLGIAPIHDCTCDERTEQSDRMRYCCCHNRLRQYDRERVQTYRQIIGERVIAHYTSCMPSALEASKHQSSVVANSLLKSTSHDISFWKPEPWNTESGVKLDNTTHSFIIQKSAMYMIYVQVARIFFTETSLNVNGEEWLRCQHRPATHEYNVTAHGGLVMGRESCSMMGARPLLAGDTLKVRHGPGKGYTVLVSKPQCTYMGIVELT